MKVIVSAIVLNNNSANQTMISKECSIFEALGCIDILRRKVDDIIAAGKQLPPAHDGQRGFNVEVTCNEASAVNIKVNRCDVSTPEFVGLCEMLKFSQMSDMHRQQHPISFGNIPPQN